MGLKAPAPHGAAPGWGSLQTVRRAGGFVAGPGPSLSRRTPRAPSALRRIRSPSAASQFSFFIFVFVFVLLFGSSFSPTHPLEVVPCVPGDLGVKIGWDWWANLVGGLVDGFSGWT